jgi:hypothetical protein
MHDDFYNITVPGEAALPGAVPHLDRADEDGVTRAFEIRAGDQLEFSPEELHVAEQ